MDGIRDTSNPVEETNIVTNVHDRTADREAIIDSQEVTEQEVREAQLLLDRLDISNESERISSDEVRYPLEEIGHLPEVSEVSQLLTDPFSFPVLRKHPSLHTESTPRPFTTDSPIFDSAEVRLFRVPCFVQILGNGFSKYNDKQTCRKIIDFLQDHQLHQIFVLNEEKWTPEHAFVALQDDGGKVSLAVFNDHPMISDLIQKPWKIAHHLNVIYFKNSEIIENLSIY